MKIKVPFYSLLFTGLALFTNLNNVEAQYSLNNAKEFHKVSTTLPKPSLLKKNNYSNPQNIIKLGIDNFFLGRFDIAYERVIDNRNSLQFEVGMGFPVKVPTRFIKSFTKDDTEYFAIKSKDAKWTTYSFSLEYRRYLIGKQESPNGLYLAPYLKYKPRSFKFEGEYTRPDSVDINNQVVTTVKATAEVKGGWRTMGIGVSLGYQFIINDRISIDVMPIGLGVDIHSFHLKFTSTDPGLYNNFEKWEEEVTSQIKDIPIVGDKLKIKSGRENGNENFIKANLTFPFIAYRGGVWIGYAF